MRIAYVAEINVVEHKGVMKKIMNQVNQWNKLEQEAKIFIISPTELHSEDKSPSLNVFSSFIIKRMNNRYSSYLNRISQACKLAKAVKKYDPQLIYYRQNIWYPGLINILKQVPSVMELNTVDVLEMNLMSKFYQLLYFYGRKKINRIVAGFVAVTEEIAKYYKKYDKPIITISNGYEFESLPKKNNYHKNTRPQLIFVGSPGMVWHGVDKVVQMAKNITEYDFHLVGVSFENGPSNIINHGTLNKENLIELYKKMDVGIGTMALYRKGLNEASPLKVREYLAFGIPVIVGYKDTDLYEMSYVLNIGNYENNVLDHIDEIREFVLKSKQCMIDRTRIEKHIGLQLKEQKRLEYLKYFIR